jgi:hypothetical protein
MTTERMPDATSKRQKGRLNDFWLVASCKGVGTKLVFVSHSNRTYNHTLFMFPSRFSPMVIMAQPRVTKPCADDSRGQLRAKKPRKSEHSETTRNKPAIAVMT